VLHYASTEKTNCPYILKLWSISNNGEIPTVNKVPALTTFAQSPEPASLKIGNALFVLYLFIFSSCILGVLGWGIVFFWICFIYVFKIEDWPSIDEHRTPSLFSSDWHIDEPELELKFATEPAGAIQKWLSIKFAKKSTRLR
jgi:hypothetical protein